MIASIIPIRRMPRRMGPFDYTVPTHLEQDIQPGQLVTIPLRKSEVFGLVFSLSQTSQTKGMRDIINIVHKTPLVDPAYLAFFQKTADLYGVSVGTIAQMSLLPMQKRKLKKIELNPLELRTEPPKTQTVPNIYTYSSEKERALFLKKQIQGTTLILLPEIKLLDHVLELLPNTIKERAITWHSELTVKEQFDRWLDIRNKKKTIVIGTRGACLLPIPNLQTIIIDHESDDNHKHWDQLPRFHTKDLAAVLQVLFPAIHVHYIDSSPSFSSYFQFHKKHASGSYTFQDLSSVKIQNMNDERKGGNFDPLSEQVKESLLNTKTVAFFLVHRRGYASSIGCKDCGFIITCPSCKLPQVYHKKKKLLLCHYCHTHSQVTQTCPTCKQLTLEPRGMGSEQLEAFITEFLNQATNKFIIHRMDSDNPVPLTIDPGTPTVIIGTKMAIPYIPWKNTELICIPDIDTILHIPEYSATEKAWNEIVQLNYKKDFTADIYLQTHTPEHVLFRSLNEPERVYRTDLNARMAFNFPPYSYIVRYSYGHANVYQAQKTAEHLISSLKKELTGLHNPATISDYYQLHPSYYRGRHWYGFVVKLHKDTWKTDLITLNKYIPQQWKIDPNPNSLLSP